MYHLSYYIIQAIYLAWYTPTWYDIAMLNASKNKAVVAGFALAQLGGLVTWLKQTQKVQAVRQGQLALRLSSAQSNRHCLKAAKSCLIPFVTRCCTKTSPKASSARALQGAIFVLCCYQFSVKCLRLTTLTEMVHLLPTLLTLHKPRSLASAWQHALTPRHRLASNTGASLQARPIPLGGNMQNKNLIKSLIKFVVRANKKSHRRMLRQVVKNRRHQRNVALVHATIYCQRGFTTIGLSFLVLYFSAIVAAILWVKFTF